MKSLRISLFAFLLLVVPFAACGPSQEAKQAEEREQAWAELQDRSENLKNLRQDLRSAREEAAAQAEEAMEEAGDATDELAEATEEGAAAAGESVATLQAKVESETESFVGDLVGFINKYAGFEGEEMDDIQASAIRMKSGEDLLLAEEWVRKGGDYKRAIDIIKNSLVVDPDYGDLQAALDRYESDRYMTEERFSQVEKGMTQDEVRALLGQVMHNNVREYKERDVIAWFYPRTEGAAAAVFFRKKGDELTVYDLNFEAVATAADRAADEG